MNADASFLVMGMGCLYSLPAAYYMPCSLVVSFSAVM